MAALRKRVDQDREWLAFQPQFDAGWLEGFRWVARSLISWVSRSARELGLSLTPGMRIRIEPRCWEAWSYHWSGAVRASPAGRVDGQSVLDLLRKGIRPASPGIPMKGDILRDVVLAATALEHDPVALGLCDDLLRGAFVRVFHASRFLPAWELDELRTDLFDRIVGQRRLTSYRGVSSLKTWMIVVSRHELTSVVRSRRSTVGTALFPWRTPTSKTDQAAGRPSKQQRRRSSLRS